MIKNDIRWLYDLAKFLFAYDVSVLLLIQSKSKMPGNLSSFPKMSFVSSWWYRLGWGVHEFGDFEMTFAWDVYKLVLQKVEIITIPDAKVNNFIAFVTAFAYTFRYRMWIYPSKNIRNNISISKALAHTKRKNIRLFFLGTIKHVVSYEWYEENQ